MPQKDIILLVPYLYIGVFIIGVGYLIFYIEYFSIKNYRSFFDKYFNEYSLIYIITSAFKSNLYSKIPYNLLIK